MSHISDIMITGGTGLLGRELAQCLRNHSLPFDIASRNRSGLEENWQHLDLQSGQGIEEAVRNRKVVFNLASGTKKKSLETDVDGTHRLVTAARKAGVEHFIHISIVGIDKLPLRYYKYKFQAEQAILHAGTPFTILRATQFHEFIDFLFEKNLRRRISFLPKPARIQPIEARSVAEKLFELSGQSPSNQILNLGGPEVLTVDSMAQTWMTIRSIKSLVINIPLPGALGRNLRGGALTCIEMSTESLRWLDWLKKRYHG